MNRPKMEGPAAAMFADQQPIDDGFFSPAATPSDMRAEIIEARINEIYDFLLRVDPRNVQYLPINRTHRNPLDAGLNAQDTSRINHTGVIKR